MSYVSDSFQFPALRKMYWRSSVSTGERVFGIVLTVATQISCHVVHPASDRAGRGRIRGNRAAEI
jgi:hypothetical protein